MNAVREEDGQRVVDLDCELVNGDGRPVVRGEATATITEAGA